MKKGGKRSNKETETENWSEWIRQKEKRGRERERAREGIAKSREREKRKLDTSSESEIRKSSQIYEKTRDQIFVEFRKKKVTWGIIHVDLQKIIAFDTHMHSRKEYASKDGVSLQNL